MFHSDTYLFLLKHLTLPFRTLQAGICRLRSILQRMTSAQVPSAGFARHNVRTEISTFVPKAGRADYLNAAFCDQRLMGVKPGKKLTMRVRLGVPTKFVAARTLRSDQEPEIHVVSANSAMRSLSP
jgi:hypothetical protein